MRFLAALTLVALLATACGSDDPSGLADNTSAAGASGPAGVATRPLALTDPDTTPAVDPSQASVPLDLVLFDTFDGGSLPLSESTEADRQRLFDAIAPLDAPAYESADEAAWLNDDDLIVGYVDPNGAAWAFPARILNSHEIVNDELGGAPVAITYCPLCGSGVVYERLLDGNELTFSNTSALYENDMVMVDRETGSYWWQVSGVAIVGPRTDAELTLIASQTTRWAPWRAEHPATSVLARPEGRSYDRDGFAGYAERVDEGRVPFPVRAEALDDDRLASSARVIVAEDPATGQVRAWPTDPAREVEDRFGGATVTVVADGTGATVRTADGRLLATRSAFWFSIVSAYPDVEVGA